MVEKSVEVQLESGLKSKAAAQFVQEANRFNADVFLEKEGKKVNAKSIMGLMSLSIATGETVILTADGVDEEIAINNLSLLISKPTV